MSLEYRNQLIDQAVSAQPRISNFLENDSSEILQMLGDWDLKAVEFSKAFEILWDHAKLESAGLLLQPLLMIWRQSVELSIKAALFEIAGYLDPILGHNIEVLFDRLSLALVELGYVQDDAYTQGVRAMISDVQALDRSADRFRYPASKNGKVFERVEADLDKLFQAHFLITIYCSAASDDVNENRQINYQLREEPDCRGA